MTWMQRLDWDYPDDYTNPGPPWMIFTENTTDQVADVLVIWSAENVSDNSLHAQHWTLDKAEQEWVFGGQWIAGTIPFETTILSVERGNSGDWWIELVANGTGGGA